MIRLRSMKQIDTLLFLIKANDNMKKVKPSSKPLMTLNMKMAGRGVLIGGSMRLNKKRCASTERLGSLIKQGIVKN